ncbi:xanthine dehydrogenase/oxidase-like [Lutzomyia longipalpis]|uniref:xanthine dehydrogenase/oxidase-like n=1 Tax=Lutzomyia longipalpis TaxID=7200 RepID=UPI0024840238|nr:xanthine dehydrogenase/oxidase-like [Lutzomyia longipalpis]
MYVACVENVPLDTTLNTFIRLYANLTATKFMCREGGCGCCIVTLHGLHPVTRQLSSWSVNSCLFPIYSCHGLHIVTLEGLKVGKSAPHALQRRLAASFGSQCGYCTPGFIMTMYGLLEAKNRRVTMKEVEDSFGGNICRCTGYRPILDAFKSFATDAPRAVGDIEDLPKSCAIGRRICFETCHQEIHLSLPDDGEWHKVYTIPDILRILQAVEDRSYIMVCGNTAKGMYPYDNDYPEVYIDISGVRALRTFTLDTVLQIGANVPLSEVIEILRKTAEVRSDFFYCRQMANHMEKIAHPAVRNVGTIAGNLSIKHRHNEFISDIFILLEAIGATLTILSSVGSIKIVGVADYLKINMNSRIIVKITLPSLPNTIHKFFSYKAMQRSQNVLALLNCAFLFKFNANQSAIASARLCFGGINPHFIHATATEKLLVDRDLFNDCDIQAACMSLEKEFLLDWVLPDPSPNYRKMLAIGLFFKAVLKMCPDDKVRPEVRSAALDIERILSSGEQHLAPTMDQVPVPKLEALAQCTGDAKYINDMPYMPNEVWGALVCATEASATIVNINTTNALNMPGVVAFYGANDIPGINNCANPMLYEEESLELFSSGRIVYHGQPIGMIIAATLDIAQAAAKQVVVTYRRDTGKRPIISIKDALEDSKNNPNRIGREIRNAVEASESGLDTAHTIVGQFEIGSQYHFPLEPQTTICVPTEDGIDVHCSTHWVNFVKIIIAQVVNIPENSITMTLKRVGGAFGGKLTNAAYVAASCALACHLQRRPVRFVFSLETCMIALGKRLPALTDYSVEVNELGEIQKLIHEIALDYGTSIGAPLDLHTVPAIRNCYDNKYWTIRGLYMKTDTPANTWCRAPGSLEGVAMTENIMERIARTVKRDPLDVRLENIPHDVPLRKILVDFAESVNYRKRKMEIDSFNHMNRWKKQGITIVPLQFEIKYLAINSSSVFVNNSDGTVMIVCSGVELGQGMNTKIAQIAAKTLKIPLSLIRVGPTNALITNGGLGTVASQTNGAVGYATQKACETILARMEPVRKNMGDVPWREITHECYKRSIPLAAMDFHQPHDDPIYHVWAAACAEVEMDVLTGEVTVQRVDIAEDLGKSINPHIDIGQIEGAFVMGMGYWLHEKIIHDHITGELTTRNTWTYSPPGAKDIPVDFRITLLDTMDRNLSSVMGSKGVGEPAICLATSVCHAIRHALDSARHDAGLCDSWYDLNYPLTPDHIQQATGTKIHHFKL